MIHTKKIAIALVTFLCATPVFAETITTQAADGTVVYGETYYAELDETAPMISLFHQAGANGRGEYGPLTNWLNDLGYRVIAWDQRSGGGRFGESNRTAKAAKGGKSYCDAYPDVEAGLAYTFEAAGAPVIVWGSSYSAALVFKLAADYPDAVAAVVAASPASGAPLKNCSLDAALENVTAPVLALRPRREYEAAKAQAEALIAAGATFEIIEDGVHGSSMLVDARTQKDMSAARATVAAWLAKVTTRQEE